MTTTYSDCKKHLIIESVGGYKMIAIGGRLKSDDIDRSKVLAGLSC